MGVDLSAETHGTAIAVIDWAGPRPDLSALQVGTDDPAVLAALREAARAAFDCPHGWPELFTDFLVAHRAGARQGRLG